MYRMKSRLVAIFHGFCIQALLILFVINQEQTKRYLVPQDPNLRSARMRITCKFISPSIILPLYRHGSHTYTTSHIRNIKRMCSTNKSPSMPQNDHKDLKWLKPQISEEKIHKPCHNAVHTPLSVASLTWHNLRFFSRTRRARRSKSRKEPCQTTKTWNPTKYSEKGR